MSDRASAGVYEDRSGPKVQEILEAHFAGDRWSVHIHREILPDDLTAVTQKLKTARDASVDIVFTLGSTGVGPRDIAPEAVQSVCTKMMPGVMEYIRHKYADKIPTARLSRSLAGVAGHTQFYALPGSVRAAEQYLEEILKTAEHTLYVLHGVDVH